MSGRNRRSRLSVNAIAAAKPEEREYTLWDGTLAHFGVRVFPGVRSFIIQTRARGRMNRAAHDLARARSGEAARRTAPGRACGAGVPRGPQPGPPL